MIRIALIALLFCGCKIKNELSCENPDNANMAHCRTVDGAEACTEPGPCPGGGVCDTGRGICVECVANADCSGVTPTCNTTSNTCEACNEHTAADCASEVCNLVDGSCVDEAVVVYVDQDGDGSDCTKAAPCDNLTDAFGALGAGSGNKSVIKLSGEVVGDEIADTNGRDFTLFAVPGATLARSTAGTILSVNSGSVVTIFDLEIVGGQANSAGIQLSDQDSALTLERVLIRDHLGRGINVTNSPQRLTMRRCIVSANIGGGIDAQNVIVDMTNNLFVRNGSPGQDTGGITLRPNAGSTFEYNTVADNSSSQSPDGLICVVSFPLANNIVVGNEMGGSCQATFSLFDNNTTPLPSGTGNRNGNAMFVNTDPENPRAANYYRITTGSTAIDMADPSSTQATDIDGQTRPNGGARDMGADELNP